MEMLNNSIYPSIFTRKSTRSYSSAPIPEDILSKLRTFIDATVPLFPSEQSVFVIQPHKGSTMKISAYAKNEQTALINLAFMLQQMDLFLQSNGMGALWTASVRATDKQMNGLPYGICLVFGVAEGNLTRTGASEYKRKKADEISNNPDFIAVEAVRLAPSTQNLQPWFVSCEDGYIDFYLKKGGVVYDNVLKKLHSLDMGIAICHAVLALQNAGYKPTVDIKNDAPDKKGYTYCLSLINI